ncbi:MAG: hypothetical protein WCI57_00485 [Candidatus Berkelbacteria bacterium]
MIISVHFLAGGVAGEAIGNPIYAFLLGIILHFVLDAIPHFDNVLKNGKWNYKQVIFTALDVLATAWMLFGYLKPDLNFSNPLLWGAFGGVLPDLLDNIPFFTIRNTKFGRLFHRFHLRIHAKTPGWPVGALTQIVVVILFVIWHNLIK